MPMLSMRSMSFSRPAAAAMSDLGPVVLFLEWMLEFESFRFIGMSCELRFEEGEEEGLGLVAVRGE